MDTELKEKIEKALDLAQMEIRAQYKLNNIKGSNVLDIVDAAYLEIHELPTKEQPFDSVEREKKEINWEVGMERNALGYCATFKVDNQTFLLMPYNTFEEAAWYQDQLFKALKRFGNNTSMKSFALWLASNHWAIKNLNEQIYYGEFLQTKTLDELLKQFLDESSPVEREKQRELAEWIIDNVRIKFGHISEVSKEVFDIQTENTIKWITDKFHLSKK
jgi:hypothetical protein